MLDRRRLNASNKKLRVDKLRPEHENHLTDQAALVTRRNPEHRPLNIKAVKFQRIQLREAADRANPGQDGCEPLPVPLVRLACIKPGVSLTLPSHDLPPVCDCLSRV